MSKIENKQTRNDNDAILDSLLDSCANLMDKVMKNVNEINDLQKQQYGGIQ